MVPQAQPSSITGQIGPYGQPASVTGQNESYGQQTSVTGLMVPQPSPAQQNGSFPPSTAAMVSATQPTATAASPPTPAGSLFSHPPAGDNIPVQTPVTPPEQIPVTPEQQVYNFSFL